MGKYGYCAPTNNKALGFYQNLGFEGEALHMIKTLSAIAKPFI